MDQNKFLCETLTGMRTRIQQLEAVINNVSVAYHASSFRIKNIDAGVHYDVKFHEQIGNALQVRFTYYSCIFVT